MVEHFLRGNDVFVSLPTGSGKSLCYCLLPKAFDLLRDSNSVTKQSIAVVVSPQSHENCKRYGLSHDISDYQILGSRHENLATDLPLPRKIYLCACVHHSEKYARLRSTGAPGAPAKSALRTRDGAGPRLGL